MFSKNMEATSIRTHKYQGPPQKNGSPPRPGAQDLCLPEQDYLSNRRLPVILALKRGRLKAHTRKRQSKVRYNRYLLYCSNSIHNTDTRTQLKVLRLDFAFTITPNNGKAYSIKKTCRNSTTLQRTCRVLRMTFHRVSRRRHCLAMKLSLEGNVFQAVSLVLVLWSSGL